jgi:polyhydroxyalkanoate synthesis repressor PhaR
MVLVKDYVTDFALQQENERMDTGKVVIKKYANRRLYDTCNSRYINLEDIAALVRNGKEVQVVDAGTGDDITRVTLTQIIVEDAKDQPAGLPLELLRQLIVTTDHVGQEFIMWYLKSAFDSYQKVHSSLQDRFSQMQSAALSPVQMLKNVLHSVGPEKSAESNPEMDEMRKRIVELEMQLQESKMRKKRSRKKT